MSDEALCADLDRRCRLLLDRAQADCLTLDDVWIVRRGGRIEVCILSDQKQARGGYWVSSVTVYDSNALAAEQVLAPVRDHVISVLQRRMILDELADV